MLRKFPASNASSVTMERLKDGNVEHIRKWLLLLVLNLTKYTIK